MPVKLKMTAFLRRMTHLYIYAYVRGVVACVHMCVQWLPVCLRACCGSVYPYVCAVVVCACLRTWPYADCRASENALYGQVISGGNEKHHLMCYRCAS